MNQKDLFHNDQPDNIDLKEILTKYARYWHVFLISLAICGIAAFVYLYFKPLHFRVQSTMLLKEDVTEGNALADNPALGEINLLNIKQKIDNEIVVFKSINLMQRVFGELSLHATYHVKRNLRTIEIFGSEVPIRLSFNKLHPTAYGKSIIVRRKTSTTYELEEDEGKSSHKYGEEVSKPYGSLRLLCSDSVPRNRSSLSSTTSRKWLTPIMKTCWLRL
jgi:hypothetical protein